MNFILCRRQSCFSYSEQKKNVTETSSEELGWLWCVLVEMAWRYVYASNIP